MGRTIFLFPEDPHDRGKIRKMLAEESDCIIICVPRKNLVFVRLLLLLVTTVAAWGFLQTIDFIVWLITGDPRFAALGHDEILFAVFGLFVYSASPFFYKITSPPWEKDKRWREMPIHKQLYHGLTCTKPEWWEE